MFSRLQMNIPDHTAEGLADFTGRMWVFDRLRTWLEATTPRTFLITGEPGCGKSTLAARLVQISTGETSLAAFPGFEKNCFTYTHFCQASFDSTLDPLRFVEALSQQLANCYPPFARILLEVNDQNIHIDVFQDIERVESGGQVTGMSIKELHIANLSPRVAFDRLVRKSLGQLYEQNFHERILILVDALDEAITYPGEENIVTLLERMTDLPTQVRFLLTSRPDPRVLHLIGPSSLNLIDDAPNDVDDVREYAYKRLHILAEPQRRELADRVAEAAAGIFLYARYVLNELIADSGRLEDPAALVLPQGLEGHYRDYLQRELHRRDERWADRYRPLLGLLAVARGDGLTRIVLAGASGLEQDRTDDALRVLSQYLTASSPDGPRHLYHESFREFLLDDLDYHVYPTSAHERLAGFFLNEYGQDWLDGDLTTDASYRYSLAFTPSHLLDALTGSQTRQARRVLADQLTTLLTDFAFLQAKALHLGVERLARDFAMLRSLPQERGFAALSLIAEAIDLARSVLSRDPVQLTGQLLARLSSKTFPELQAFQVKARAWTGLPWLCPHRASLTPPGGPQLRVLPGPARALAVTPDGRYLLTGARDQTVQIWDYADGELLRAFAVGDDIHALAITADGRYAIIGTHNGLQVWDMVAGTLLRRIGHVADTVISWPVIGCVAVTRDGRVIGGLGDTIGVWSFETGERLLTLEGHTSDVEALALLPDGRHVLSASGIREYWSEEHNYVVSSDDTMRLWDLDTGREVFAFHHESNVLSVAVTPDGRCALTGCRDGTLTLWDLSTRQPVWSVQGAGEVVTLAITPDGKCAVTGSRSSNLSGEAVGGEALRLWDLTTGKMLRALRGHTGSVSALVVTPDSHYAISAGSDAFGLRVDRSVRIWDLERSISPPIALEHSRSVTSVAFVPSKGAAVSASEDGMVKVWDLETGHDLAAGQANDNRFSGIAGVAVTPNGRRVISRNGSLTVWDVATGQRTVSKVSQYIMGQRKRTMNFTLDGRYAVCPSRYGLVVFDLLLDDIRFQHSIFSGTVNVALATPDAQHFVAGTGRLNLEAGEDPTGYVVIWDAENPAPLHVLRAHADAVTVMAVSPAGDFVVSGSPDTRARVWQVASGMERGTFKGHVGRITALAVTPDGRHVVSGSADGTIELWELDGARRIAGFSSEAGVTDLEVSPDGAFIVAGDDAGRVLILSLKGFPAGPLVVAPWLSSGDPTRALGCPSCRTWHQLSAEANEDFLCPTCSQLIRLAPFFVEGEWQAIAAAWSGETQE